jgi:hypothetical protein
VSKSSEPGLGRKRRFTADVGAEAKVYTVLEAVVEKGEASNVTSQSPGNQMAVNACAFLTGE